MQEDNKMSDKKIKVFVSVPTEGRVMDGFFCDDVKPYLAEKFDITYSPLDRQLELEEIKEYVGDAEVIITGWDHLDLEAKALEGTNIKLIAHTGGSVADLITPSVWEAGYRVISGNDMFAESVAEGALAYILMALRRLPHYVKDMKDGGWRSPHLVATNGLLDQTVGLVGMGTISKYLIKLLKPFHVKLKLYSGYPIDEAFLRENNATQASIEEIFATCKVVSLHSALNDKTKGMIGKEHFDLLQDDAVFINSARAAIVREEDLMAALSENRFRAVLDVYHCEPLDANSPLRSMDNVYLVSHMAGPTGDRRPYITKNLADDIERFFNGEPLQYEISSKFAQRMTKMH